MEEGRRGKVLMGTCGWSDESLLRCGRFYPASCKGSPRKRLQHYSSFFPCVEVDTSTYQIPSVDNVKAWQSSVPKGFIFHVKAFGLFASKSCPLSSFPARLRGRLPASMQSAAFVGLEQLPPDLRNEVWASFNAALLPLHQGGNLGVVVFQFHLGFHPTEENRAHILQCRRHLDARYAMAVEFRCRKWVVGAELEATCQWLSEHGLGLIAADELRHETYQKDRQQTGLSEGQKREVLPIALSVTRPDFVYVRVHRREGTQRVLSDSEHTDWAARLGTVLPKLQGPVYFLWGTDWEDAPMVNFKKLSRLLGDMQYDWQGIQKLQSLTNRGSLRSFFTPTPKKVEGLTVQGEEAGTISALSSKYTSTLVQGSKSEGARLEAIPVDTEKGVTGNDSSNCCPEIQAGSKDCTGPDQPSSLTGIPLQTHTPLGERSVLVAEKRKIEDVSGHQWSGKKAKDTGKTKTSLYKFFSPIKQP